MSSGGAAARAMAMAAMRARQMAQQAAATRATSQQAARAGAQRAAAQQEAARRAAQQEAARRAAIQQRERMQRVERQCTQQQAVQRERQAAQQRIRQRQQEIIVREREIARRKIQKNIQQNGGMNPRQQQIKEQARQAAVRRFIQSGMSNKKIVQPKKLIANQNTNFKLPIKGSRQPQIFQSKIQGVLNREKMVSRQPIRRMRACLRTAPIQAKKIENPKRLTQNIIRKAVTQRFPAVKKPQELIKKHHAMSEAIRHERQRKRYQEEQDDSSGDEGPKIFMQNVKVRKDIPHHNALKQKEISITSELSINRRASSSSKGNFQTKAQQLLNKQPGKANENPIVRESLEKKQKVSKTKKTFLQDEDYAEVPKIKISDLIADLPEDATSIERGRIVVERYKAYQEAVAREEGRKKQFIKDMISRQKGEEQSTSLKANTVTASTNASPKLKSTLPLFEKDKGASKSGKYNEMRKEKQKAKEGISHSHRDVKGNRSGTEKESDAKVGTRKGILTRSQAKRLAQENVQHSNHEHDPHRDTLSQSKLIKSKKKEPVKIVDPAKKQKISRSHTQEEPQAMPRAEIIWPPEQLSLLQKRGNLLPAFQASKQASSKKNTSLSNNNTFRRQGASQGGAGGDGSGSDGEGSGSDTEVGNREGGVARSEVRNFELAERIENQLNDPRLRNLAGKIDKERLIALAHNPNAQFLYDTRYNTINVVQKINDVSLRITVLDNQFKIISVGPIRERNIVNSLKNGRFLLIGEQKQNLLELKNNGVKP